MTSNILKKENTREIVQANLLKYTFLAKRQELRKNVVPLKYRNNKKQATLQLENERINLLTNLNVALTESKLKQDKRNQKDISKLCTKKIQAYKKLHDTNKYLIDLNEEIRLNQIKDSEEQNSSKKINSNISNVQQIHCDLNNLLFRYTDVYNSKVKEQKELRRTLDGLLQELAKKKEKYDAIMYQLNKGAKVIKHVGETALKSNKEREQAHSNLETFRETSKTEEKQRDEKMQMAEYKFKSDLESTEFLRVKHGERNNSDINNSKESIEQNRIQKDNKELVTLMKYLVHISGDTDLKTIIKNVLKINSNKESLFRHLMFLEQQCLELENSISRDLNIAIDKKKTNDNRNDDNECTLKHNFEIIQKNDRLINSTQEFADSLKAVYEELCDKIYTFICRPLKIKMNEPLNEENISGYMIEMENKSYELLYQINCIENSCLTEQTEDPLTSDGESTQNLISKDLNGIEIKVHHILKMEEVPSSQGPPHDNGLNDLQTPTTCQENQAGVVRMRI